MITLMVIKYLTNVSSFFLCSKMVSDCFHASGVVPVIHISTNNWWMASCMLAGRCISSSLGISSGPGVLLLLRCDKTLCSTALSLM